jgi:hypothetical protein
MDAEFAFGTLLIDGCLRLDLPEVFFKTTSAARVPHMETASAKQAMASAIFPYSFSCSLQQPCDPSKQS